MGAGLNRFLDRDLRSRESTCERTGIAVVTHFDHLRVRDGLPRLVFVNFGRIAIIAHIEHLSLRIGRLKGFSMLLGAVACLLVISHTSTWENTASAR